MKAKEEPCKSSHPRQAAQLTAAGAVSERSPATKPMQRARRRREVKKATGYGLLARVVGH
jgi:hypothetical protein